MPWQNFSHITGIFQNTGLFGGFVALGFIICVGLFFFSDSGKWMIKPIVLLILCTILTFQVSASGSRASWVATVIVIGFLLYRFVRKFRFSSLLGSRTKQSGIVISILVLCLLIFSVFFLNHLYHLKKDSANGRLLIAKVSMNMVKDSPLFGTGISGFRTQYLNYQADYFQQHPDSPWANLAGDTENPFNEFLKILVEQGIIGLLLFFGILYCLFEPDSSLKCPQSTILQSVILFILIFGLFSYPSDKIPFVALLVFSIAGLSKRKNPVFNVQLKKMRLLRILVLFTFCLVLGKIAEDVYKYAQSCRNWNQALASFSINRERSLLQLKELYPELENNPVFLTTYGKALSYGMHYTEAITVLEKAVKRQPLSASYIELGKSYEADGFPERAIGCWTRAGWMVPSLFTPLYLAMKLHFKNGECDTAREQAGQLLTKRIKIDKPEIDSMKREARIILNFNPP